MKAEDLESRLLKEYEDSFELFTSALQLVESSCDEIVLSNLFPNNVPRLVSRMKSPKSIMEKVKAKIGTEQDFKKWITNSDFKSILFDNKGIGDTIGIRLIFPYVNNYDSMIDIFVSNYLVREKGYRVIKRKDVKSRKSGYNSVHSHVMVPIKYKGITNDVPLEIQITSEMRNVWMEVQHNLLYKNKEESILNKKYLEELYSILSSIIDSAGKITFLAEVLEY